MKEKAGYIILLILGLVSIVGLFFISPIAQDATYHQFADQDAHLSTPNFWNVISNFPFFIVGTIGMIHGFKRHKTSAEIIFYLGVAFVSLGSAYYHWQPNNGRLVWDRLPMTVAFMAICALITGELINENWGRKILWPMVAIGLFTIIFWKLTDDLRFYALIQFYPMLAIPVILLCFSGSKQVKLAYWLLILFYAMAKLFEYFDQPIYDMIGFMGGHSLKHIMAATGIYIFFKLRKKIS